MQHSANDFGGTGIFGGSSQGHSHSGSQQRTNNVVSMHSPLRGVGPTLHERSLVPVTVKQILSAPSPASEEPFKIDGRTVSQIRIIATIKVIKPLTTHTQLYVDDYGCSIQCNLWSPNDTDMKELQDSDVRVNDMVKIVGKVDTLRGNRAINIHNIEKVEDFNEMFMHGLEVILAHELQPLVLNKHLPTQKQQWDAYMDYQDRAQTAVDRKISKPLANQIHHHSPNRNHNNHNNSHNNNNSNVYPAVADEDSGLNDTEKKIMSWLRRKYSAPSQGHDDSLGYELQLIAHGTGITHYDLLKKSLENLSQKGLIFDTIDLYHYALAE